jgi:hypothetical protein
MTDFSFFIKTLSRDLIHPPEQGPIAVHPVFLFHEHLRPSALPVMISLRISANRALEP